MKVTTYVINEGQSGQYYGLKTVEDNQAMHYAPTWKTERGAQRWANRKGFDFVPQLKVGGIKNDQGD